MPSLKRCRLGSSNGGGDDDDSSASRKKRKISNGYYPLNLLGEIAAGIIPMNVNGLLGAGKGYAPSWCTEVPSSPEEVETKSNGRGSVNVKRNNRTAAEAARPPLVRTSRGRVQVLPSRFKDSVIDNWRKDGKTMQESGVDDEEDEAEAEAEAVELKKEKFSVKQQKLNLKNRRNLEKNGYKYQKYETLYEEDEMEEDGYMRYRNFHDKKYPALPRNCVKLEQLGDDRISPITEYEEEVDHRRERSERRDGLYGPEDFYAGDIVWAKSGKKDPFWPAIVIDPMTQAPELVLRACIPEAACVMFFGHFGNENQRVWLAFSF